MINDLRTPGVDNWKYIDDSTISEVVNNDNISTIQNSVNEVQSRSTANKLQLNSSKCKELEICFTKSTNLSLPSVVSDCHQFEVVTQVRIPGLTISNDLKWNEHITNLIKKVNKRFYLMVHLKRAKVPAHDIIIFYCTCIRQVLEYCCQVYHYGLPNYLSNAIERVQKRVMSLIYPYVNYDDSLILVRYWQTQY